MVRRLNIKEDAYPMDWRPSRDKIDKIFSSLDQTDSKNPDFLKDNYGFDAYTVRYSDSNKDTISLYVATDVGDCRYDETFYILPDVKKDTYKIITDELGERTVGNLTDVWDIISVCIKRQIRGGKNERVYNMKRGCDTIVRRLRESRDYRDSTLDKYKLRHYLVGSQYQMWNDADFDKVVSALRKMESTMDEKQKAKMDMFASKCVMDADRNAGISDAIYPDYTEVIMQYPELKAIADKYGLEYYLEGKRTMNKRSKRLREDFDDAVDKSAIIQKFEDYGFFQDDPSDPRYFYDRMPFKCYATYDSEENVAYIDFNPAGNAVEIYHANINSVDDADNFLQKLHDWEEYDSFDLLENGLISFGFRKTGPLTYTGQNDFGDDIYVDFNEDTMTLMDDGYGEPKTLGMIDGFEEFLAK